MQKTDIDWCDQSWNPVTGCEHGCEYCYARNIARRFGGWTLNGKTLHEPLAGETRILDAPLTIVRKNRQEYITPYPYDFMPTFYRYRLDQPQHVKKPQKIFVTDMGDIFGSWVPIEWIREVWHACAAASWHRYIFLTKDTERYFEISFRQQWLTCIFPISVFGITATNEDAAKRAIYGLGQVPMETAALLNLEPLHGRVTLPKQKLQHLDWVIVGAETGNSKDKILPKREWVAEIVEQCQAAGTPVFLKRNLAAVWDGDLIQEYPDVLRGVGE